MKKFTVLELMVVVAVIGILISILLPAMAKSRQAVKAVLCLNNLKQIGVGEQLSLEDNSDKYTIAWAPSINTTWDEVMSQYWNIELPNIADNSYTHTEYPELLLQLERLLLCPIDELGHLDGNEDRARRTYSMNGYGFNGATGEITRGISSRGVSVYGNEIEDPSMTFSHLEQPSPYNLIGGAGHSSALSIYGWQMHNSVVNELSFHKPLTFNYLFSDGSVRPVNVWTAWGNGQFGMWDRHKE